MCCVVLKVMQLNYFQTVALSLTLTLILYLSHTLCRYVSDTARRVTVDDQNLHKHETFYCAVQTCCYLVCYHGVTLGAHIR